MSRKFLLLTCAAVACARATLPRAAENTTSNTGDVEGSKFVDGEPLFTKGMKLTVFNSRRATGGNFTEVALKNATNKGCAAKCADMPTCLAFQTVPVSKKPPTACALYTSLFNFTADGDEGDEMEGPGNHVYLHKARCVATCKPNEYFGFYNELNYINLSQRTERSEGSSPSAGGCEPVTQDFGTCRIYGEYEYVDWTNGHSGCAKGTVCGKSDDRCIAPVANGFARVGRGLPATGGNYSLASSTATGTNDTTTTNTTTWNDTNCSTACNATSTCMGFSVVGNTTINTTECRLYTSLAGVNVTGNGTTGFFASIARANSTCSEREFFMASLESWFEASKEADSHGAYFYGCTKMGQEGDKCPAGLYKREWIESYDFELTNDGCERAKKLECSGEEGEEKCKKRADENSR